MKKTVLFLVGFMFLFPFVSKAENIPGYTNPVCLDISSNWQLGTRDTVSRGEVARIQEYLNVPAGAYAGYFGKLTFTAIKGFQASNGLPTTGYVGPLTRAKLKSLTCPPGGNTAAVSSTQTGQTTTTTTTTGTTTTPPSTNIITAIEPSIASISPATAAIGSTVTVSGSGFSLAENTINFGVSTVIKVAATTNQLLTFTVPSITHPACLDFGCKIVQTAIVPGKYLVSIKNTNGISNEFALNVTDQAPTTGAPTISNILPATGVVGTQVSIVGSGFTTTDNTINFGDNTVITGLSSSNGTTLSFTVPSSTHPACLDLGCKIATVPITAGAYNVSVTNKNGTSGSIVFRVIADTVTPQAPAISSFAPGTGTTGTQVALLGTGFTQDSLVHFGTVTVTPTMPTSGSLIFTVPSSTTAYCSTDFCVPPTTISPGTYNVWVSNTNGNSNTVVFTVTATVPPTVTPAPVVTSLSVASIQADNATAITVNGYNFNANSAITLTNTVSGTLTMPVSQCSPSNPSNCLTFKVPSGTAAGTYSLIVRNGDGANMQSNTTSFTVLATQTTATPIITSVGPSVIYPGQTLTAYGNNLGPSWYIYLDGTILNGSSYSNPPVGTNVGFQLPSTITTGSHTLAIKPLGNTMSNTVNFTVSLASSTPTLPAPTLTLTTSPYPNTVASGGLTILFWSTTNATSCVATGDGADKGWYGTKIPNGNIVLSNLTTTGTYTMTCTGTGGSITKSATVMVTN